MTIPDDWLGINMSDERIYRRILAFKRLMRIIHYHEKNGWGPPDEEDRPGLAAYPTRNDQRYMAVTAEAVFDREH